MKEALERKVEARGLVFILFFVIFCSDEDKRDGE